MGSNIVHITTLPERISYHADRYASLQNEGKRMQALREGNKMLMLIKKQQLQLQQLKIEDQKL
jgi:conjugal transfer/entry exclusion protein